MEIGTLRDSAYFDVCRICLELSSKIDLISVEELGEVLLKILPSLDLQLTMNPQVCNSCSKFVISTYNFVCRSSSNQDRIKEFLKANNLQYVDLKSMLRTKNRTYTEESSSYQYYETVKTPEAECSLSEHIDTNNFHKDASMIVSDSPANLESPNDEILSEEVIIEDEKKYIIPDSPVEDSPYEMTMEEVVENWFPEEPHNNDFSSNHIGNAIRKRDFPKSRNGRNGSKKVKVEIISDLRLAQEKSPSIKSEIKSYYTQDKVEHNESKEFRCFQCHALCANKQELNEHVKRFHVSRKSSAGARFLCKFCHKTFKQKLHLDGHYLSKHGYIKNILDIVSSKVHFCDYCAYKTINVFNLKGHIDNKHMKKSSSTTMRNCLHCQYSSNNRGNFETHMRTHSVKFLFTCCYCSRGFAQKVNLHAHYLRHHLDDMGDQITEIITSHIYTCPKCQWRTLFKDKYEKHVQSNMSKCFYGSNSTRAKKEKMRTEIKSEIEYEIIT